MEGRVKYFVVLVIVICLIYVQQSFLLYAKEDMPAEAKPEEIKQEIYQEKEGQGISEEKTPGEEKEEGGAEEGEENPGEEENPEGEENPGEGGSGEGGTEKPPEEKPEIPIEKYKVNIPEEDGDSGYYRKKPEVSICHVSQRGQTRYFVKYDEDIKAEGVLTSPGEKAVIKEHVFSEGKNVLYIWMEEEDGTKVEEEKLETKKVFRIDTKEPQIHMEVPKGFDAWYQGKVTVKVRAEDKGSKVEKLSCKVDGENAGSAEDETGEFLVEKASALGKGVEVAVTAKDLAGNESERIKTLYIDRQPPQISVTGAENYKITGKPVQMTLCIEEENQFSEFTAQVVRENVKGKKKSILLPEWKQDGRKRVLTQELKEDGIYTIHVKGTDAAGHNTSKKLQIIIDKMNPVIRYTDQLQGQYLKFFQWDYPIHRLIEDFTTYTYEIKLDGQFYQMGKQIRTEGKHRLSVYAVDAAKNKAYAEAEFFVDHTPPEVFITNVEMGGEYEEERTFKTGVKSSKDIIRRIQINGKDQKLEPGKTSYEYTLDVCKDYEVVVLACDRAGNKTEKRMYFQIIPKPSILQKAAAPVIRRFWPQKETKEVKQERESAPQEEKREKVPTFIKVTGIGAVGIIMMAAGMLFYGKRWEREVKEEDETDEIV